MKLYNGIPLPALPEWDKTVYTHGFIQYGGVAGMEIYNLIVSTASGVMGDSYTVGEHTYSAWVVAANETAAENLSGAYPGISTKEWLQFEDGKTVTASTYDNIVWTNTDILKADGSVYLEASKPFDLESFKTGLALGLCGKALPWKAEPVAWMYNGVRLPDINTVWTDELKAQYPYSLLKHHARYTDQVYLYVASSPFYVDGGKQCAPPNTSHGWCLVYLNGEFDYFRFYDPIDEIEEFNAPERIFWSNHDIINTDDNSVYLAASEPVPVYE